MTDPQDGTRRRAAGAVPARRRARSALVAVALGVWLAGCGTTTRTVTQPASDGALGRPIGGPPPPGEVGDQDARAAAQAFLSSYLQVSYGRASPGALRSASRALREQLRAQDARVPPGVRNRRPRVVSLRLQSAGAGRVRAIATVDDGDLAPYPLFATLQRGAGGRWVAVSVGG